MRQWVLCCGLLLAACGPDLEKKAALDTAPATTGPLVQTAAGVDTDLTVASDTVAHASYRTPPAKRPSGIYQVLLPADDGGQIRHTISFRQGSYRLQEEYLQKNDSVVLTEGTWAPSQGFIWLYKEQVVRGRYTWHNDTLQYFNPQQKQRFSLAKLTPAANNAVWRDKQQQGAVLYGVGTEPFWSVEVTKHDSAVLSMPDWATPLRVKLSLTTLTRDSTVYLAEEDSLRIVVLPRFCSDGMSDFAYANRVLVYYRGRPYQGCGVTF